MSSTLCPSRRSSAEGSWGLAERAVCGKLLESWEKPQLNANRLVIPLEHKSNSFLRRRPRPDHRRLSHELLQFLSLKAEITFDA
jgi:hypothetical protein